MLKRTLSAGLLALTLGVGGLLSTPNTAEAQRWRQYTPFQGYYYDTFSGRNPNWNNNWSGYYNNWNNWNNNQTWYPGYYSNYYNNNFNNSQRYWDPYYGRYYTYDPFTGQSSWVY